MRQLSGQEILKEASSFKAHVLQTRTDPFAHAEEEGPTEVVCDRVIDVEKRDHGLFFGEVSTEVSWNEMAEDGTFRSDYGEIWTTKLYDPAPMPKKTLTEKQKLSQVRRAVLQAKAGKGASTVPELAQEIEDILNSPSP